MDDFRAKQHHLQQQQSQHGFQSQDQHTLQDVVSRGLVAELATDQYGSRFLQQRYGYHHMIT